MNAETGSCLVRGVLVSHYRHDTVLPGRSLQSFRDSITFYSGLY